MDKHYYAIVKNNSFLSHAERGARRKHKYVAREKINNRYRYFYSQAEYSAYLKGRNNSVKTGPGVEISEIDKEGVTNGLTSSHFGSRFSPNGFGSKRDGSADKTGWLDRRRKITSQTGTAFNSKNGSGAKDKTEQSRERMVNDLQRRTTTAVNKASNTLEEINKRADLRWKAQLKSKQNGFQKLENRTGQEYWDNAIRKSANGGSNRRTIRGEKMRVSGQAAPPVGHFTKKTYGNQSQVDEYTRVDRTALSNRVYRNKDRGTGKPERTGSTAKKGTSTVDKILNTLSDAGNSLLKAGSDAGKAVVETGSNVVNYILKQLGK